MYWACAAASCAAHIARRTKARTLTRMLVMATDGKSVEAECLTRHPSWSDMSGSDDLPPPPPIESAHTYLTGPRESGMCFSFGQTTLLAHHTQARRDAARQDWCGASTRRAANSECVASTSSPGVGACRNSRRDFEGAYFCYFFATDTHRDSVVASCVTTATTTTWRMRCGRG
jgi:hypothetical protein